MGRQHEGGDERMCGSWIVWAKLGPANIVEIGSFSCATSRLNRGGFHLLGKLGTRFSSHTTHRTYSIGPHT